MGKKLLLLFLFIGFFQIGYSQQCSDLFFSEYIEGSGNSKALEIYNPTESVIDLSDYLIRRWRDGNNDIFDSLNTALELSGTIQPGDVVVITNGQTDSVFVGTFWSVPVDPLLYSMGDLACSGEYPTAMYFNGDDALSLERKSTGEIIDIFGKVGEDPNEGWSDDPNSIPPFTTGSFWLSWSQDHTLRRKPNVTEGVTLNPASFNVSTEWDSLPQDTWDYVGFHVCDCHGANISDDLTKERASVYPNPVFGENFFISTSSEIKEVLIFTLLGDLVLHKDSINKSDFIISDFSQPAGVYFVRIVFSNGYNIIEKIEVK